MVIFSVEVNDGFIITSLPSELINTTELKVKNSYQWQPLQTYVAISQHFMVKANGVRFRGTITDCNTVMKQLFYQVSKVELVLEDNFKIQRIYMLLCQSAFSLNQEYYVLEFQTCN